jgi:7,8-dihydropterin-6-yl-methyl-4-(beta-D-ribofuranosyl)aminobenzene 5'-phosphate synthase
MNKKNRLKRLKITVLAEDSVGYDTPYLGQHGISFLLTCEREGDVRNVLVDVAQHPDALIENVKRMQINLSCIDAVVLTHCHYDHTRGVAKILREIGKNDIPVIAHPDIFRAHFISDPCLRPIGVMDGDRRADIESSGGSLFLAENELEIMPGLISTGEVERLTDFEKIKMNLFTIEKGQVKNDVMKDDISVVANVEGRGLIIVTGCSHSGIVNITRQSIKLTGTKKIHGIIGGLHLIDASEERIKKTTGALKKLNPDWVYAGHCTGFRAQVALYNVFKDRFSPLCTGMVMETESREK